jgi:hyperosmotically inducible periplasmic protein
MPAATALWALMIAVAAGAGCQTTGEQTAAAQAMDDAAVSAAVQMKLTGDRTSHFTRVDVAADRGVVELRGVVPSPEEKARAEELARRVDGVRQVTNRLQVQREPAKTGQLNE